MGILRLQPKPKRLRPYGKGRYSLGNSFSHSAAKTPDADSIPRHTCQVLEYDGTVCGKSADLTGHCTKHQDAAVAGQKENLDTVARKTFGIVSVLLSLGLTTGCAYTTCMAPATSADKASFQTKLLYSTTKSLGLESEHYDKIFHVHAGDTLDVRVSRAPGNAAWEQTVIVGSMVQPLETGSCVAIGNDTVLRYHIFGEGVEIIRLFCRTPSGKTLKKFTALVHSS